MLLVLYYNQGGITYSEGAPPQYCKDLFYTLALKLTTNAWLQKALLHCIASHNVVSLFNLKIPTVGSISALFTCSLLLHLKVVGVELFGCPPYPRHILCSVQFLQRHKFVGKVKCKMQNAGGVQSKKNKIKKNPELLSSNCTPSLTSGS